VIIKEADLPLEVVILVIGGMAMPMTRVLLFPVYDGTIPYYSAISMPTHLHIATSDPGIHYRTQFSQPLQA